MNSLMQSLIDSYHSRRILPVFNRGAHSEILRDYIDGYADEGYAALERFSSEHGYRVLQEDYGFRYKFCPGTAPDDYEQWTKEDVPVENSTPQ